MHPTPVRPATRRTAVAVAALSLTATTGLLPASAHATPAPPITSRSAAQMRAAGNLNIELRRYLAVSKRHAAHEARRRAELRAERIAERRAARAAAARGERVIELAMREAGDPYVYGAAGPSAFDCSGYTMYVFGQLGISLPHNAAAQAAMAERVSDPQVGDLVFFGSGHVYHVAIYAGDGYVWHAPHPGTVVRKERIWTSDVFYGRVG